MKRINNIYIKNYRAYYDEKEITLPNGENLIIYGENGSGKSSLFKSLNSFFASFVSIQSYEKNKFRQAEHGEVRLSFKEYDNNTQNLTGEPVCFTFDGSDNTSVPDSAFLKSAALTKGFMDYRDLLRVYLYDEENLFDLFVKNILRGYILNGEKILNRWNDIITDFWSAERANNIRHRRAVTKLNDFKTDFEILINSIVPQINEFLEIFPDFDVKVNLELRNLSCQGIGKKNSWKINSELFLSVKSEEEEIDSYRDYLNEARLSAIAVCIFLAALKKTESAHYKILYLDDVFIGLDAGNRKPILKIISTYFSDYQIIISTYDRQWFHIALQYFKIEMPKRWKSINLYVGKIDIMNPIQTIQNPILVEGESDLEKAICYLHHRSCPDYPAAANYFRKTLEEKLEQFFPVQVFYKEEKDVYNKIANYELTNRLEFARRHLLNIHSNYNGLRKIEPFISALLHPMSHFNKDEQIYKTELLEIEKILVSMDSELSFLKRKYKLVIEAGTKIQLSFHNHTNTYTCQYILKAKDNFYIYKSQEGKIYISDGDCETQTCKEDNNGTNQNGTPPKKIYKSINEAKQNIRTYLNNTEHRDIVVEDGHTNIFINNCGNFIPLDEIIRREQDNIEE